MCLCRQTLKFDTDQRAGCFVTGVITRKSTDNSSLTPCLLYLTSFLYQLTSILCHLLIVHSLLYLRITESPQKRFCFSYFVVAKIVVQKCQCASLLIELSPNISSCRSHNYLFVFPVQTPRHTYIYCVYFIIKI